MRRFLAGAGGFLLAAMLLAPLGQRRTPPRLRRTATPRSPCRPSTSPRRPTGSACRRRRSMCRAPRRADDHEHRRGALQGPAEFLDRRRIAREPGGHDQAGQRAARCRHFDPRLECPQRVRHPQHPGVRGRVPGNATGRAVAHRPDRSARLRRNRCLSRALLGDVRELRDRWRNQFPHAARREINGIELGSDAGSFGYFNEYALIGNAGADYEYSAVRQPCPRRRVPAEPVVQHDDRQYARQLYADPGRQDQRQGDRQLYGHRAADPAVAEPVQPEPVPAGLRRRRHPRGGCASVNLFANGISGHDDRADGDAGRARAAATSGRSSAARWEHEIDAGTTWRTQIVYDNKDINQPTGATSAQGDQPAFNVISGCEPARCLVGPDGDPLCGVVLQLCAPVERHLQPRSGRQCAARRLDRVGLRLSAESGRPGSRGGQAGRRG